MKTATYLILLLFISFLATPTVVSVIDKNCDISVFFSASEEELSHKAVKEFKVNFINENTFKIAKLSSSLIITENQLKHDNITPSIFSPPPNV
ncbi:hypothetical protein [Flavobacterium sp.]|uniref:hypothetical protein n=1 Tax=Flavobacterium sp. TaxID=239 RepID=UPI002622179D|nr:hypothetical protein [Flavobacterium sp.]MDD3004601.1 hypothetical protein [Flavobacterium sp.]